MDRISGLPDELLVKMLSFLPTNVAVSTGILSKRWELLWMWVPKLDLMHIRYGSHLAVQDFINKNLSSLRAPVIESFRLRCSENSFEPEYINEWVATTVSRCVRELDMDCRWFTGTNYNSVNVLLPSSLFTCESLVTLKLNGEKILVDVPRTVSLPSLKTLLLDEVTYLNEDSLRLLLSNCPVLEDLVIRRNGFDNAKGIVVISPSLLRLTLPIDGGVDCSDEFVIVTRSLKYLKVEDYNLRYLSLATLMPNVEEADITVEEYLLHLLDPITSVKRLSLRNFMKFDDGIIFKRLEHLKLCIRFDNWSKLLFRLLHGSPTLRVLNLSIACDGRFKNYEPISWNNGQISVPSCLLESLEIFEFAEYRGSEEERDFVSFIIKNACHLKSSTIRPCTYIEDDDDDDD